MFATLRAAWLPLLILGFLVLWVFLERSPEQAGGGVVLRWVVNSQERDQLFAQAAKRAFEAKHSGIRIQFIKQNEGQKVEAMIAGGDAPDIVSAGLERVHYYIRAGVFRDLRPFMTPADEADLKNFFPVTLEPFVQQPTTINPQPSTINQRPAIYALPWAYVPSILFYNKNLFDKHNVPYPNDHWTWEDYRQAAIKLTHDLDGDGYTDEFGASFEPWQEGFDCWIYQNGGRVLSPDGLRVTYDDPHVVEAVAFLHRLTREDKVMPTHVNKSRQTGINLFESGRLAMNGPYGSFVIPTYRTYERIDWDIASVPAGPRGRGTLVAPIGFGVTSQSTHPREAWELVKFLSSEEGQWILADTALFVPCRRDVVLSERFLNAPGLPKNKYALVAMMDDRDGRKPWGISSPWSGNRWADVNDEAINPRLLAFLFGIPKPGDTALSVCRAINKRANEILDEDRASFRGVPVDWTIVTVCAVAALSALGIAWVGYVWRYERASRLSRTEKVWGYLAISPWLIGFLVFSLGPILVSAFLSFTRYSSLAPPADARFVGLDHYKWILSGHDELFLKSLSATAKYVILSVPFHLAAGLLLALLMNAKLRGITLFRTLYYLPAVMPMVASAVLFRWIFEQQGLLNYLLGGFGHASPKLLPNWLQDPSWAVPSVVLMGLWGVGAGMMIYLAGLQNIPTQLYEAARIDGAGILAQFRSVTLPMLSPVLFFNLVMGIIGAFQVFTSAFVLFNGEAGPEDSALFYSFYLYRKAFEQFQIGYGSALAWILFVIVLALTLVVFRSSSFWVYYEGQKEQRA